MKKLKKSVRKKMTRTEQRLMFRMRYVDDSLDKLFGKGYRPSGGPM